MTSNKPIGKGAQVPYIPTAQYAAKKLVKPQTLRRRLMETGSYFGTRPLKLENGRLAWPNEEDAK